MTEIIPNLGDMAKPDSFVVEMDSNSRIKKSLSRKGSGRIVEKKLTGDGRDINMLTTVSPRATLQSENLVKGNVNQSVAVHHQITIMSGCVSSPAAAAVETKFGCKRFGLRRSPYAWILDPRMILLFFATVSCIGTVMLIYFTLSMGKPNGNIGRSSAN